jgi:hypothetical protein
MRITRVAVTGFALAALTLGGAVSASAASAQPPSSAPSGPVTITLSPEQVTLLCGRLTKVDSRANKLAERINGGPDVKGSTEWLKARAKKERDAGRETSAKLLEERAARRAGRIDELNKIKAFATDFKTKYCGGK